jgi:hypothetical protein
LRRVPPNFVVDTRDRGLGFVLRSRSPLCDQRASTVTSRNIKKSSPNPLKLARIPSTKSLVPPSSESPNEDGVRCARDCNAKYGFAIRDLSWRT